MDDPAAAPAEAPERAAAVAALGRHFTAGGLDPAGYESRAIAAAAAVHRAPFHSDRSGRIEYRFVTERAGEIVALVRASR